MAEPRQAGPATPPAVPVTGPAGTDAALAGRVETMLRRRDPSATVRHFDVLRGGHSGVSHFAEVSSDGGEYRVIVRSSPPGRAAHGRHDVQRQARAMAALADRVPVPHVYGSEGVSPDGGAAFFVVANVPGTATEPVIEPPQPDETSHQVATSWDRAIDTLVALHAVDPVEVGLDEPPRSAHEELKIWADTFAASRFQYASIDSLLRRLERTAPDDAPAALVHGDFRLGNLVIAGSLPNAIIDWEIWSVGHPLVDLGWFVLFTDPGNFPGIGREVPGTPSVDDVVAKYLALSGTPEQDLHWCLALGAFKLAAIQAHNQRRHLDGRYHDPYQELLGPSITRLLDKAAERLQAIPTA